MSGGYWDSRYQRPRGLYRDSENGWIFGVCAGLADYFNFRTGTVRLVAAVALCLFFWPTAIAYIAATMLFRDTPLRYRGRFGESDFWRRGANDWGHQ